MALVNGLKIDQPHTYISLSVVAVWASLHHNHLESSIRSAFMAHTVRSSFISRPSMSESFVSKQGYYFSITVAFTSWAIFFRGNMAFDRERNVERFVSGP